MKSLIAFAAPTLATSKLTPENIKISIQPLIHLPTKESNKIIQKEYFDSREEWPNCINVVRYQGDCGSCWAFACTEVLADRFAIYGCEYARDKDAPGSDTCTSWDYIPNQINYNRYINNTKQLSISKEKDSVLHNIFKNYQTVADKFKNFDTNSDGIINWYEWNLKASLTTGNNFPMKVRTGWYDIMNMTWDNNFSPNWTTFSDIDRNNPINYKNKELPPQNAQVNNSIMFEDWHDSGIINYGPIDLSVGNLTACVQATATNPKDRTKWKWNPDDACSNKYAKNIFDGWNYLNKYGIVTNECMPYFLFNKNKEKEVKTSYISSPEKICQIEISKNLKDLKNRADCAAFWQYDNKNNRHTKVGFVFPSCDPYHILGVKNELNKKNYPNDYKYSGPHQLQIEIAISGPISSAYKIYNDFIYVSDNNNKVWGGGQTYNSKGVKFNSVTGISTGGAHPLGLDNDWSPGDDNKALIYSPRKNATDNRTAHAVKIIGWGVYKWRRTKNDSVQDFPYWIIQNSWGITWGTSGDKWGRSQKHPYYRNGLPTFDKYGGFFWMLRGKNICDIENEVVVAQPDMGTFGSPDETKAFNEIKNIHSTTGQHLSCKRTKEIKAQQELIRSNKGTIAYFI